MRQNISQALRRPYPTSQRRPSRSRSEKWNTFVFHGYTVTLLICLFCSVHDGHWNQAIWPVLIKRRGWEVLGNALCSTSGIFMRSHNRPNQSLIFRCSYPLLCRHTPSEGAKKVTTICHRSRFYLENEAGEASTYTFVIHACRNTDRDQDECRLVHKSEI